MDRISDLPDDLLQGILLHLRSTPAATRTSVHSRRWRRVWTSLPDLVLANNLFHHGASFLDAVDDALAAYAAGPAVHLRALKVLVPYECHNVPAGRVAAWLLFASRRLTGDLDLRVNMGRRSDHKPPQCEIELPPFERATGMALVLRIRFLLRPPPAGVFAALADLDITLATMDAGALEALISSQCPRLENLTLFFVTLVNDSDVSIRSASLRRLKFLVRKTRRLNVAAPNLQELDAILLRDAHIAAPNLAKFVSGYVGQVSFANTVRHLRQLELTLWSAMAPSLLRQLDTVDELRLHAPIREQEFQRFMDDTGNLPKCETLSVSFTRYSHGPAPIVLHLLRRGSRIKKLVIISLEDRTDCCSLACPCRSPERAMAHGIILDSLEEIEFRLNEKGDDHMKILKPLLSISSLRKLKNVEIGVLYPYDVASLSDDDEVYQKVREICPPNIKVKLNLSPNRRCQNRN